MQAALLSLVACLSCTRALEKSRVAASPQPAAPGIPIVDRTRPGLPLEQIQPSQASAAVEATFRLAPDRRVLTAIGDVYELSTGRTAPNVEVDFRDGKWQIQCAGQPAGSLPELPTFREALDLLTQWSAHLRPARPAATPPQEPSLAAVDNEIQAFTPQHLFNALALIAKRTGGRSLDAADAARAADATTLLASQTFDWFDFADPLRSRALALTAIARQIDPQCCATDEALIANLLGYTKEAQTLAGSLPRPTYAASFILGSAADPAGSGVAFEWLAKRNTLATSSLSKEQNQFRGSLDGQFSTLLLTDREFEDQAPAGAAVATLILQELESGRPVLQPLVFPGELPSNDHQPLQRFDRVLPDRIRGLKNAVIDADSIASYYESNFYTALLKQYFFYTSARAVRAESKEFIQSLGTPSLARSTQLVTWMNAFCDAKFGTAIGPAQAVEIIKATSFLGGSADFALLREYGRSLGDTAEPIRHAAAALYPQLDTRPAQIYDAGVISMASILDPQHRDRYMSAAVERMTGDPDAGYTAWFYYLTGNRNALRNMVEHPKDVEEGAEGLTYLATLGGEDVEFVHRAFEENGLKSTNMNPLSQYAQYLNDRGEASTKERFMRAWLAKWGDRDDAIMNAWVSASLANALDRQGKYQQAWAVIRPHIPVYSENVLEYGASILQHLGRTEEANAMARDSVERYPGAVSRAAYATLLWRERRFADAAAVLDPKTADYSVSVAKSEVSDAFVETFGTEKDTSDAVAAYGELIKAGVDWQIIDAISSAAADKKHPELAFALVERLIAESARAPMNGRPESVTVLDTGYRALTALKGPDAAIAWLESKLPPAAAMQAITVFYENGEYDLSQRFADAVSDQLKTPEAAAVHAAALLSSGAAQTDVRWQNLVSKISLLPNKTALPPIAKYLAGLVDERQFFEASSRTQNHPDAEYFAAVKWRAMHDRGRALPLMIAASFGPQNYPPSAWALADLGRWSQEGVMPKQSQTAPAP